MSSISTALGNCVEDGQAMSTLFAQYESCATHALRCEIPVWPCQLIRCMSYACDWKGLRNRTSYPVMARALSGTTKNTGKRETEIKSSQFLNFERIKV